MVNSYRWRHQPASFDGKNPLRLLENSGALIGVISISLSHELIAHESNPGWIHDCFLEKIAFSESSARARTSDVYRLSTRWIVVSSSSLFHGEVPLYHSKNDCKSRADCRKNIANSSCLCSVTPEARQVPQAMLPEDASLEVSLERSCCCSGGEHCTRKYMV